ncbi:sulfatase-like hydrolase/transferase [Flavobacteriaceae bacterium]|nr:sulfatase-like hydrolase/transferase [Flavobacteriaceae bacterium]MDB2567300.1 sulfatase-like hydrolase/transferase [Flavobacteriaceae bacterium]MDC0554549.1 sulfatase-like hydrolase/transferase [Flavobacteriaceae bacterium]
MKRKFFKFLLSFLLIVVAIGIWFSQNWYKMPKYISNFTNSTYENVAIEWENGPISRTNSKPNIIVVLIDDLGFNQISSYGGGMANGKFKTPNIDKLASDGVLCTNGYSSSPVCSPSRASLLTGRFATRFGYEFTPTTSSMMKAISIFSKKNEVVDGIYHNDRSENIIDIDQMGIPQSERTIAEMLKPEGYHNIHIGKWHLGHAKDFLPRRHGFDESLRIDQGSLFLPEDDENVINAKLDFDPIDKVLWGNLPYAVNFNEGPRMNPDGHLTDYLTDEAVKVIEKNKNRPFFLYLAYWAVHSPLQAKKEDYEKLSFIENHEERVLASMVMTVDRGVGKIRDILKKNKIDDNTIIIFTSDNGAPGYIGLPDLNKPYRGWKLTHFEGGVHVPFIVSYPNKISKGRTYKGRVSNLDIFSTVASVAGVDMTRNDLKDIAFDGANLIPYLSGENEGEPERILFNKSGDYSFLIKEGWKLQVDLVQNKKWLYNLNEDPTEQLNLSESNFTKLNELEEILNNKLSEQVKPIWPSLLDWPIFIDKTLDDKVNKNDEYIFWAN